MRRWWAVGLVVFAACSTPAPTTTVAPTTTIPPPTTTSATTPPSATTIPVVAVVVPEGYVLHDHQKLGFVLALPESWRGTVLPTIRPDLALTDIKDKDMVAALLARIEATTKAGAFFFAYDLKKPTVNLNLFRQPTIDNNEGVSETQTALETTGATTVEAGIVDLPIGPAVQVIFELAVEPDDGPTVETYGEVYLLTGPGWTAELTLAGTIDEASAGRFKKIATTVRLYPRPSSLDL